ncbi:hypothetical protein MY11210_006638 [Beauveria gryllotalpidicola]
MAGSKASADFIAGPGPQQPASEASNTGKTAAAEEHVEDDAAAPSSDNGSAGPNLHKRGALGFIQQQHTIPTTGDVMPTGKWEYIFFCIYYFSNNGALNSFLLDITGILFAAQLVTLLTIGPYADYGNWRPWVMIS